MISNTKDLAKFGYRELKEAAKLLETFKTDKDDTCFLGSSICLEFNPNSGCVFLVDDDGNVAMMLGEKLEDFLSCPDCGEEGSFSEFLGNNYDACNDCCTTYYNYMSKEAN
tara:strand:+ start:919 stop:1251 length:333 start_codon:yes stop_codon:yes gene_type:complete